MPNMPPQTHFAVQGLVCPECQCEYNHVEDVYTGEGLNPYGRASERLGTKTLLACEDGHAWIMGTGEHKGQLFIYVRFPNGGEVSEGRDVYDRNPETRSTFRFTGKPDPQNWSPGISGAWRSLRWLSSKLFFIEDDDRSAWAANALAQDAEAARQEAAK